jgi:hypothetical protein
MPSDVTALQRPDPARGSGTRPAAAGPAPHRPSGLVGRHARLKRWRGLLATVVLAAGHAGSPAAQTPSQPPAAPADRVYAPVPWPAYPYPFPGYAGPCVALGFCTPGWWWRDRPARRPQPPPPPSPAEPDIWSTTGSPWGYVRRLPPPTPADQIQPRYRDASTIRPEFAERAAAAP